ncbi:hypothetical protein [Acinetobacter lactucae]|uniref:hypothetical protein n=1 Tax=Acinetobacter lactucae TaxID=1785128 RepID=UPI0015F3F637|nr:hypothetical protein [Acinetobacter lactucae]
MKIDKNTFLCFLAFFTYSIWSFYTFGSGKVGDFLVTPYDEIRYLEATNRLIVDLKAYGFFYTIENYYNYSQSVHFGHYFIFAYIRYFFNDSMFFWSVYQNFIYSLGVLYFSKYMMEEYNFIKITDRKYISLLVFLYPVFHYLAFSIMRDISIFTFFTMSLYFYKRNKYIKLLLVLILLSTYRINMVLCVLLYMFVDQVKGANLFSVMKYLLTSIAVIVFVDSVTFGFIFRNLNRLSAFSLIDFINELLVLFFSPLPFSIDTSLPEYLRSWFKLSFFICLLLISFYLIILIYRRFREIAPSFPILVVTLLYVFIYTTEAGVGFRQASIILPFIYIPVFFYILRVFNNGRLK